MATVESYRALLKVLRVASKVTGLEIWTAPGRYVPASYNISFHVGIYFISTVFTLYKYKADPVHMMKVLIMFGSAVQLYIKFFVIMESAHQLQLFMEQIERNVVEPYQNGTEEEMAVLGFTGRILWTVYRVSYVTIVVGSIGFGLYPLYAYYVNGIVMPLFLYELPYYDYSTVQGYFVNMLFQVNLYVIGIFGFILSSGLVLLSSAYTLARVEIALIHLRAFNNALNDPQKVEANMGEMRIRWRDFIQEHQQCTSFLNSLADFFGLICLVQVIMGVFTLCNGMLLVALTDWYPAYAFLVVMFIEMTFYFMLGNFIDLKIDDMYNTITSMPWYNLPVIHQKEYGFLLYGQQRPMVLTAYGIMPMNFETYMSVMRLMYQFFVMVMQYVR